jgi:nucleoside-diphosphate-sugar epimerase
MAAAKSVLFIGGTGVISSACVSRAVEQGLDVTVLNRGRSDGTLPEGARRVTADIRDAPSVRAVLGARTASTVLILTGAVPCWGTRRIPWYSTTARSACSPRRRRHSYPLSRAPGK